MRAFGLVLGPVIRVFDRTAAMVTERGFGVEVVASRAGGHTLDELSRIIDASTSHGSLTADQAELLARAVELGDRRVAEIMVPAPDIAWIEADEPMTVLRLRARTTGHSRFPVRDRAHVVGTVHIKDLLDDGLAARTAGEAATEGLVVPESEPLRRLLTRFRTDQRTFAVVVDEYGSVAGIATVEDVLEQLVGDIEDEFDPARAPSIRRIGRGRFVVAGRLRLERLEHELGVEVPRGDYETVAGLVMDGLGRVPEEGAVLTLEGVELTVRRMAGVRVAEVEVVAVDRVHR
jgi:CBS domain containing-hemolysin-like protein